MKRAFIIGTLVTLGLIVACDDDSLGPATTGSISLRVVVATGLASGGTSQAVAARRTRAGTAALAVSPTKGADEKPAMSLGPATKPGVSPATRARRPGRGGTTEDAESVKAAASEVAAPQQTAPPAPPRAAAAPSAIDNATLRVIGPTNRTLTDLAPGSTVTVDNLSPGAYTVVLEGYVSGEVDHFGIRSGVQVTAGRDTPASLTFSSFRPVINPIASPTTDIPFVFDWPPVPNADGYIVDLDSDPGFPSPLTANISGTAAVATVAQAGTYYVRARAVNNSYVTGGGAASDYESTQVIEDFLSGPDASNPAYLGFMDGITPIWGVLLNILPAGDEDWFSATVCQLDKLVLETWAGRLDNPSPLDTYLELWDPAGASIIAENDDIDLTGGNLDSYLEAVIPADGDYLINVRGVGTSVGSYELLVDLIRGPNNNGSSCTTSPPPAAEVFVYPFGDAVSGVGTTLQFTAEAFDTDGNPIAGKTFTWMSLNPKVATVDAAGLATAARDGQVTIAAEVDGIVGYALLTVTVPGATPVSVWTQAAMPVSMTVRDVWGPSVNNVFAVGSGGNILRYDGSFWNPMASNLTADVTLYGVWGTSINDIFAVGSNGVIAHFNGFAWSPMTNTDANWLWDVWGSGPNDVYASGEAGTILHYDGTAWSRDNTHPGINTLYRIWGTASDNLYVVGTDGQILRYDGSNWTMETSGTTELLAGIWGASKSDIFVAGTAGTMLRYDGNTWNPMTLPVATSLYGLWGSSSDDLYNVGESPPRILRFDGANWRTMPSPEPSWLWSVWGTYSTDVYAVGTQDALLRGIRGAAVANYGTDVLLSEVAAWVPDNLLAFPITVTDNIELTHLSLITTGPGSQVKIGLYSDAGNVPDRLLTQGARTIGAAGVHEIPVPQTNLAPGTYWIVVMFDVPTSVGHQYGTGKSYWISFAHGFANSLPATWTGVSSVEYADANFYGRGFVIR